MKTQDEEAPCRLLSRQREREKRIGVERGIR
jgi:hypothetical protein